SESRSRLLATLLAASYLGDGVAARVAGDHEPRLATGAVVPQLAMRAGGVVAQVDVIGEARERVGRARVRARRRGVAEIGKLAHVALAAMGTGNAHQCRFGCAPAPRSSIRRQLAKRSRRYAAATGCGSSRAMRCAKHQPEAGVALKPP